MARKLGIGIVFLFFLPFIAFSQDWHKSKVIILKVSSEFQEPGKLPNFSNSLSLSDKEKKTLSQSSQRIRELTTEILSGMIYGYLFTYTPASAIRNIAQQWQLERIGSIESNDENLSIVNSDVYNASLYIITRYNLSQSQVRRAESWNTASTYPSEGSGSAKIEESESQSKINALHDAIRQSVRSRLKTQLANKPKIVKGRLRLSQQPQVYRSGFQYFVKVTIDMVISEVQQYKVF